MKPTTTNQNQTGSKQVNSNLDRLTTQLEREGQVDLPAFIVSAFYSNPDQLIGLLRERMRERMPTTELVIEGSCKRDGYCIRTVSR